MRVHDEAILVSRLTSDVSLDVVRGAAATDHLRGDEVVVLVPFAYAAPTPTITLTPAFSLATNASEVRAGGSALDLRVSGLNATLLPSPHTLRALGVSGTAGRLGPAFDGPGDGPAYPGVTHPPSTPTLNAQTYSLHPTAHTLNLKP